VAAEWIDVKDKLPRGPCELLLEDGEVRAIGSPIRGEYVPYIQPTPEESKRVLAWRRAEE
jgi:hypothetical protein